MAAPQWTGPHAKAKSAQEAKALFRHNDKDRRMEMNHANPHIDKSKTHENFTFRGLTYQELCDAFDAKMAAVDQGKPGSGKNARTVLQSVILYPPKGLTRGQEKDWFMDAGRVMEAQFGDNLLEIQFDMDEEHEYPDKDTGEKVMSRNHGHARLFPEVDGKLNGKAFSRRAVINKLNYALDRMSVQQYGVHMMDGTKKKGKNPVEALKAASLRVEVEQLEERAETIIADAMDRATEITTEARRDARATRKEADQDREQARRERNAAFVDAQAAQDEREDAEEYARTTRATADQDAKATRNAADRDAEATRKAAERDAALIRQAAERDSQTAQGQVAAARREREREEADRDKAVAARKAAQAALQGDYRAWATQVPKPGAAALLGVLGAAVEAAREKPPAKSDVGRAWETMMAMVRRDRQAASGPHSVGGPTMPQP